MVTVTAEALLRGRRPDGSVRRYGLEADQGERLLHVLATRTGQLAYCGYRPRGVISPTIERAQEMERMVDPQTRGFSWCRECYDALTPQPDPAIWGPPRPPQT